jgi:hypothetical protein
MAQQSHIPSLRCDDQETGMGRRKFLKLLSSTAVSLAFLFLGSHQPASAIVGAPEPIDRALPDQWRGPVAQFLRELGMEDVESALAATKGGDLGGVYSEAILLRLEHSNLCVKNRCLTIIGHIKDGVFHSHAMFVAGGMMTQGDAAYPLIGKGSVRPPVYFLDGPEFDPNNVIVLRETPKGWIVYSRRADDEPIK